MAKKYVRKLQEIEAVQATENNIEELKAFAGGVKKIDCFGGGCCYDVPGVPVVLYAGDWLIKHNGRLEVKTNQAFFQEYEPK